ncbi:Planctomycete PGAMP [Rhodopirellula europaea SH398]|uniref:Planctomycete PGAMP n=1 Tax=Rhodopirellula europaea SH398 TaxID=1263868 RepID=M5S9R5_9BACT|nr:Planctomycete PGAMP [Rhodopirellula europaea SH398]
MWVDVGRWPTNFPSFSIPGAMPQATMTKAVGQQDRMQKRNYKTHASGCELE